MSVLVSFCYAYMLVSSKLKYIQMRQQLIKRLYEILKTHETKHGYLYLKDTIPQMFTSGVYFFFDKTTPI